MAAPTVASPRRSRAGSATIPTKPRRTEVLPLLRTLRPQQWVKNVFVAAPVVFSRHLEDRNFLAREAIAVLAFCLLSGAVYCFNDVRDVEADRLHPTKKYRPIASGAL